MVRHLLISTILSVCLGCTQGTVVDQETGAPLGDVDIQFFQWPPAESTNYSWAWPRHFRQGQADHSTRSSPFLLGGANYGFGSSGECAAAPQIEDILAPEQWYRASLTKPGYHPGYFYFFHEGYLDECSFLPCPDGSLTQGPCTRQDFELQPLDQPVALLPDLIVDVREFVDAHWQCVLVPDGPPQIGLRIAVGTANVGPGSLHLLGNDVLSPDNAEVAQRVDFSDGSHELFPLPRDTFEFHPGHNHIHFRNWVRLQALLPTEDCRDPQTRQTSCALTTGEKLSFCIMDLEPFDEDIRADFDGIQRYPDPPTCDSLFQGLSPGWKDVYHSELEGQLLRFGALPDVDLPLSVRVEAEVDPEGLLQQRTRANSLASILIARPDDLETLCSDDPNLLDCRGNISALDFRHRQQCPDYLP